jgi:hypothetical protein
MNLRTLVLVALTAVAGSAMGCAKSAHQEGTALEGAEKEAFGRMSVEELSAKMDEAKAGKLELAVFDNNQHERFDKGHIPGAKWVAFNDVKASDLPANKDATLVFYCANEH